MIPVFFAFLFFYSYIYIPLSVMVIGGELQERLIPVPYSKNTTDQAVSSSCFHFPRFYLNKKKWERRKNRKKDASACGIFISLFIQIYLNLLFIIFFTYLDLSI